MIRIIASFFIIILSALFLLLGVGFLFWALYFYLVSLLKQPSLAALAMTAIFFIVAVIFLLFAIKIQKKEKKRIKENLNILALIKNHPGKSASIALFFGFALGGSSEVRKLIISMAGLTIKHAEQDSEICDLISKCLAMYLAKNLK